MFQSCKLYIPFLSLNPCCLRSLFILTDSLHLHFFQQQQQQHAFFLSLYFFPSCKLYILFLCPSGPPSFLKYTSSLNNHHNNFKSGGGLDVTQLQHQHQQQQQLQQKHSIILHPPTIKPRLAFAARTGIATHAAKTHGPQE